MELLKKIAHLDAKGQGVTEYALLLVLIAILVIAILALVGSLVSDAAMAVIAEVPGSRCKPGLKMV